MAADLRPDSSLRSRLFGLVEHSWSREHFRRNVANGDSEAARSMGVDITRRDRVVFLATAPFPLGSVLAVQLDACLPFSRLAGYGHADFTTDHNTYAA